MIENFGSLPDGRDVARLTLRGDGLTARILTLGAIVQDLRLEGVPHPLVLGAATLAPYLGPMGYFGAIVGRFANRIAAGQFTLDGQTCHLPRNSNGRHCLHGGPEGSAQRLWSVADQTDRQAVLTLRLEDGEMGFPGRLDVVATITIEEAALLFDIRARTDRATPCSFAQHSYFTLDDSGTIAQHRLRLAAESYLPVDDDKIPTGEVAPVAGTRFDYRSPRALAGAVLDHNFCLGQARTTLRPVAWLSSTASGLQMELATSEPGLQVYTAGHLPQAGVVGHDGQPCARFAGVALEAQAWPDAPNRPHFPSAILRPGEVYHQRTRLRFGPAERL